MAWKALSGVLLGGVAAWWTVTLLLDSLVKWSARLLDQVQYQFWVRGGHQHDGVDLRGR